MRKKRKQVTENDTISKTKLLGALKEAHEQIQHMENLLEEYKWLEGALRRRTRELNERIKELDCLRAVSSKLAQSDSSLHKILADIVNIMPSGWQYPEYTCVRSVVDGYENCTSNFIKTKVKQSAIIRRGDKRIGKLEVYLLPSPIHDKSHPFLPQEESLLEIIATWIGLMIEYRKF